MIIQCTRKLLDQLRIEPSDTPSEVNELFAWHASIITVNRRKTVVLQNDKNNFGIIIHGLKVNEFKDFDNIITDAIKSAFILEGVSEEVTTKYLSDAGSIAYTKTRNQSRVGYLNYIVNYVRRFNKNLVANDLFQFDITKKANRMYFKYNGEYVSPLELFISDLEKEYGDVISTLAIKFRITLALDNHEVWREIIVPITKSFYELHKLIQLAFNWEGYHLHEFFVYSDEKNSEPLPLNHPAFHPEGYKVLFNFKGQDEELFFEEDYHIYLENGTYLFQVPLSKMKYIYDYGDFWEHYIDVVDGVENYDKIHAELVDYHGDAPPEDVGGSSGFDHYLEAINDKNHPEHLEMMEWSAPKEYEPDFVTFFNKRAKFI